MKRLILVLSLISVCIFAKGENDIRPVHTYAFLALEENTESIELLQFLRNQIFSSKRGEIVHQTNLSIDSNLLKMTDTGVYDISLLNKETQVLGAEKLILIKSSNTITQIQLLDLETGKLEYKNSLPESIQKTLIQDFYSFLDRKNIYLAISEKKSSPSSPVKFSSLKSKYVVGESIRFELEANEDNFIYVLLVPENKGEEPVLLFPNPNQTANYLKKGEKITIPEGLNSLRTVSPYGRDKIKAFASKDAWDEFQYKNRKGESFF